MLINIGVVSVESDDVGNGHMHRSEIDCTMYHVCGGFEIFSHSRPLTGEVRPVMRLGSSAN
jgi:hypothetical protein